MKWNFSIQNNELLSEIKQPNKNWINDHNFNKDLTFKIMEKKNFAKQMSLSIVNNPDY